MVRSHSSYRDTSELHEASRSVRTVAITITTTTTNNTKITSTIPITMMMMMIGIMNVMIIVILIMAAQKLQARLLPAEGLVHVGIVYLDLDSWKQEISRVFRFLLGPVPMKSSPCFFIASSTFLVSSNLCKRPCPAKFACSERTANTQKTTKIPTAHARSNHARDVHCI